MKTAICSLSCLSKSIKYEHYSLLKVMLMSIIHNIKGIQLIWISSPKNENCLLLTLMSLQIHKNSSEHKWKFIFFALHLKVYVMKQMNEHPVPCASQAHFRLPNLMCSMYYVMLYVNLYLYVNKLFCKKCYEEKTLSKPLGSDGFLVILYKGNYPFKNRKILYM